MSTRKDAEDMRNNLAMIEHSVPFNKPFVVGKELYYIAEALITNRHLSGDGLFTKKCEGWLEKSLGCTRALLTHSCTAALEMVALLCDVKPGDEIIMPSFTFVSTANAFVLRGAVPVFVDIRPDTLNIDERLIPYAITPRTRGIVPVHYAGVPCAMDEILQIAEAHVLWVAEDAAHALLSTYKGRFLGTIGNFGCLSFHETKNVISGEGGALLVNSHRFVERSETLREMGTDRKRFFRGEVDKYTWVDIGSSYPPSDMVAAFLYAQLEYAQRIIAVRCKIVSHYNDLLKPLQDKGCIELPLLNRGDACNGHMYFIITRSLEERSRLIKFLTEKGIEALFHYIPLHSSPGGIKYGRPSGSMKVTDEVSDRIVRLPLFFDMTAQQVKWVAKAITYFFLGK